MKFKSAEQFAGWLQGVFDERLRTCLADMRAAGYSADEVAEAAVVLSERARLDCTGWADHGGAGCAIAFGKLGNALPSQLPEHL